MENFIVSWVSESNHETYRSAAIKFEGIARILKTCFGIDRDPPPAGQVDKFPADYCGLRYDVTVQRA